MEGESPRRARRRKKLVALLAEVGGATQAALDTGTQRTHFVALTKGRRGLGDELAEKLEEAYGKPAGWFDQENGSVAWPFSEELHQKVLLLSDQELLQAENILRAFVRIPQKSVSDFTNLKKVSSSQLGNSPYSGVTEVGSGALEKEAVPEPSSNARQTNQRSVPAKGGGGA